MSAGSPIDAYLDDLFAHLAGHPPRAGRQLLNEVEAHLRDSADAATAGGLDPHGAEQLAIERFGPVAALVVDEPRGPSTPLPILARQVVATGLLLGSLGALAVGLSGLVAGAMRALAGSRFLVDLPANGSLDPASCTRWMGLHPGAATCALAAQADWVDETIWYRIAVGVLGVVGLVAFFGIRRRLRRRGRWNLLPDTVVNTVGNTVFGCAAILLAVQGIDAMVVSSGHGAGQWLSAAPVALGLAAYFGFRLLRDLRGQGRLHPAR